MDPLSHAALGRTLVALAPDERHTRPLTVAGMLGALSPDMDAVLMPFGWDLYLRVHEIGTHTAIGTVVCAVLTASTVRLRARDHALWPLAVAAWAGAASHVLLDVLSSARVRLLWPVADHQVSVPLVAMADPWLAAILIAGAATVAVLGRRPRRAAAWAIAACALFLMLKAVMAVRALDAYRAADTNAAPATPAVVQAKWAALSEWHIFDRAAGHVRFWRTSGLSGGAELILSWPVGTDTPRIAASLSLPTVRNFLRVHQLAVPAVVEQPGGRAWILWSDIRYCWNPEHRDAPSLEPIVSARGARLACALWFGGEFDRSGMALEQMVKIAGYTQRRPVAE